MATIYDDLIKVKKEREEAKEGLLKRAARFILPRFIEEPLFGKKKEEKPKEEPTEKTIYEDLIPKGKKIEEKVEVGKPEYYTVETAPGIFASVPVTYDAIEVAATKELMEIEKKIEQGIKTLETLPKPTGFREKWIDPYFLTALPGAKKYFTIKEKEQEIKNLQIAADAYRDLLAQPRQNKGFFEELFEAFKDKEKGKLIPFAGSIESFEELATVIEANKKKQQGKEVSSYEESLLAKYKAKNLPIDRGIGYSVGATIIELPTWAAEFAMTEGVYSTVKQGITITAMKALPKVFAKKLPQLSLKLGSFIVAGTAQGLINVPEVAERTTQYMIPNADLVAGDNGKMLFGEIDKNGDDFEKALKKALGTVTVDYLTERTGIIVEKPLGFLQRAVLGKWLAKIGIKESSKALAFIKGKIAWNGIIGEIFEEELAELFQAPIEERDYKAPFATPEGTERLLVETLSIGAFGGLGKISDVAMRQLESNRTTQKIEPVEVVPEVEEELTKMPESPKEIEQVIENLKRITADLEPLPPRQIKPAEVSARVIERVLAGEEALRMSPKGRELLRTQLTEQERIGPEVRLEKQIENIVDFILSKPEVQRSVAETEIANINKELTVEAEKIQAEEIPIELEAKPIPKKLQPLAQLDKRVVDLTIKKYGEETGETLERIEQKAEGYDPVFLKEHPEIKGHDITVYHDPIAGEDLAVIDNTTNKIVEIFDKELTRAVKEVKKVKPEMQRIFYEGERGKKVLDKHITQLKELDIEATFEKVESGYDLIIPEDVKPIFDKEGNIIDAEVLGLMVEAEPITVPEGTFEKWDKEMAESEDNLIEPETNEDYQEGFEAEGKEKAVFDDKNQVFHSTETKTKTPDPETRDRVSALKEPRSQLGYVYHLIRTNQIIPEDLRWIVDERNNFSQQQIGEQEMLPVKGKPGMYKINYVEELITQEGINAFYPIEDYKDVTDYKKLQEGGGIQIPEDFKENDVVKFKDETGERFGRLIDIFDNGKAIVEVSTGETEVDLYSLKKPSKLTKAQEKIAEGIFPEEVIQKDFELTTDFMEKKGIKPQPRIAKRPTNIAPKRNINSRIFDIVKIAMGKSSALPITQSIGIKGSQIMATDLEVGIIYETGKDIGKLAIDPKALKGKSIAEIVINEKAKTAQIGSLIVKGESIEEFPLIPEIKVAPQLTVDYENLIDGLNKTIKSVAESLVRPEINGVFIKNENGKLRFASTDSFRLYQLYVPADISKNFEAILPKNTIDKLSRILKQVKPESVSIAIDSKINQIQFQFDKFKVVSKLVEGEFPDYKVIFPKKIANQITFNREELLDLLNETPETRLKSVVLSLDEKNNKITFSAKDEAEGISFKRDISARFEKPIAKITPDENFYIVMPIEAKKVAKFEFNVNYLKDFLKTSTKEQIEIFNITTKEPAVLREKVLALDKVNIVRETLAKYDENTLKELKKQPFLRKSAIRLKLKEIGQFYTKDLEITSANDVADIFSELKRESREKAFVLNLTKDNKIINTSLVSIGTHEEALINSAEVLKPVLASKAKKVYFIHNHPDLDVTPSPEDVAMMRKLGIVLAKNGIEFEGGVIINYDKYGFINKDFDEQIVHYTPRVKKGYEISLTEMEQIVKDRENFLKEENIMLHSSLVAKFFSETVNPDIPVIGLINLTATGNMIGYEVIGSSFENTNILIKKISHSVATNNPSQIVMVSNIPFDKVNEERILGIRRFIEILDIPLQDVISVNKDGTYKNYKTQGRLRPSNTGISENIANYDEFSPEERAVIKVIQEGLPIPVDLAEVVKSLQDRGVIQIAKEKERVRKEKVPKPPRVFLKVGERVSQRGITISHSSIVSKRPYLVSYTTDDGKRVVRSFETYDDAKRRFDIMVEIRAKGFLKRGELPESIQSTQEQKAQAHIIAQNKRITPRQYKRLALAYTGVDSMTKMTPDQAQEFIAALKAIKPTFGGKITIPKSKEIVTQEEAETKFRDIRFGWLIDIFRTPANVFKRIGVEKQAAPIFEGFQLRRDFTNKWFTKFKQWQKELDIRGIFFKKKKMVEQSKRLFRAINNPDETIELSEKEALIISRARIAANEVADLVDDARAEVGLEPMNRRKDYITNLLTEESHFILQQTKQAPNELYALLDLRLPSSIFNRLLLERKGGLPIKEDFWQAMKAMVQVHGKYIYLNPPVHRFERFMRFYGDKVPQLSRWYIRSRINRFLNRPSKIEVWLRKVDEAITQTISKIPGLHKEVEIEWQNGVTEVIETPRIVLKIAQKSLRTLKSIRYVYDLAFSVSFYTINLTQFWLNTVPKLRGNVIDIYQSAFSGYTQMMVDFFRPSKWEYWRQRGVLTEIDNVIDQEYGMGRGTANIVNLFAKLSEFNNRVGSALAAEKNLQLLAKKGKFELLYKELASSFGEEAEAYARNISDTTQFRYGVEEKPIFFDNPVADLYYQYNTFALKQIEFTEQMAKNLEAKGILKDFREAHREGKTKEFVANLTQGQRGEFIRFIINAFILSLILGSGYVWEAIFKGIVPNQVEGFWKVLKGYWTGDKKLRQEGYRQVLLPPAWDLIEKVADYGIKATIKNAKAVKQLDLLRIAITGEGELKTMEGKKKEEITRGVAVTRLFKSYREKTALKNSKGWDLYLELSRRYDDTREKAIELIKKGEKEKARELAQDYNKKAKEDLEKLKELEVTDLRLQENIKEAKKAKIVSVEDFNRWKEEAKD